MKTVRIFTKVVMLMARMEVMELNAVRFMMAFPLKLQSINNRITLLKKENTRKESFLSVHH